MQVVAAAAGALRLSSVAFERETGANLIDRSGKQVRLTGQAPWLTRALETWTPRSPSTTRRVPARHGLRPRPAATRGRGRHRDSAGDVCVEFPSVLALVAAGRGAAAIPRIALGQAPVTVCALPPFGGRHIAAWHQAGLALPAPAAVTVLDALVQGGLKTPLLSIAGPEAATVAEQAHLGRAHRNMRSGL